MIDRLVTLDSGSVRAYQVMAPLFTAVPWLHSHQIEQDRAGTLTVRVVPGKAPSPECLAQARLALMDAVNNFLDVEVDFVDALLRDGECKCRLFIRNISLPAQTLLPSSPEGH